MQDKKHLTPATVPDLNGKGAESDGTEHTHHVMFDMPDEQIIEVEDKEKQGKKS